MLQDSKHLMHPHAPVASLHCCSHCAPTAFVTPIPLVHYPDDVTEERASFMHSVTAQIELLNTDEQTSHRPLGTDPQAIWDWRVRSVAKWSLKLVEAWYDRGDGQICTSDAS
jgi:hypothetical protein